MQLTHLENYVFDHKYYGLFELDQSGTVIYCKLDSATSSHQPQESLVGSDFFQKVATFANSAELSQKFVGFARGHGSVESFRFACSYAETEVPIRVMFVRISERQYLDRTKLIIVDIRKV